MNKNRSIISGIDWWTILLFCIIALFGWVNIYGASYSFEQTSIFDFSNYAGKQFIWIVTAIIVGGLVMLIDEKTYNVIAYILYATMILLLAITPLLASDTKGSYSWIPIGPVRLQPAEFAKSLTALAIAKYIDRYEFRLRDWRDLLIPFAIVAVPMLIIMLAQRDTGTALVFLSFMLVFYRIGMSGNILMLGVISIVLFLIVIRLGNVAIPIGVGDIGDLVSILLIEVVTAIVFLVRDKNYRNTLFILGGTVICYGIGTLLCVWLPVNFNTVGIISLAYTVIYTITISIMHRHRKMGWLILFIIFEVTLCQLCNVVFQKVLQPHQRARLEVLLGMKDDPTGAGYNINQSLIAIGSGQFAGKGYLQGTQTKLRFVPEQHTDFILCTVGEEWGFLGTAGLLILYLILILRIIHIAERQRDKFSMVYAYSVASILLFHLTINVGMVLGLLPVIGIPLPFFSYGGSSLWGFSIMLSIMLRLDAARVNKMR